MVTILNPSFEDWNQGNSFQPASIGQETADDWFSEIASYDVAKINQPHTGTWNLLLDSNQTTQGSSIYQDIPSYVSLQGLTVTLKVWHAKSTSHSGTDNATMWIDDGVTRTTSANLPNLGAYAQATLSHTVSPSATKLWVGFAVGPTSLRWLFDDIELVITTTFTQTASETLSFAGAEATATDYFRDLSDTASFIDLTSYIFNNFIPVALADAISMVDNLVVTQANKVLSESLRLQDWLKIKRKSFKRWYN